MTHKIASIGFGLLLVGCANKSADTATRSPESTEADIEFSTAASENAPEDTQVSRVHIDERIIEKCGIVMPQAFFEVDSAALGPDDENELHDIAVCLETGPLQGATVGVIGHTDPTGTDATNEELGHERADSVADYLVRCGVDGGQLDTDSMGERLASADPDDWPANRRVDIILRSGN